MGAIRLELFPRVIERFFEAATIPELWPDALHDLALACGAAGATALPVRGTTPPVPIASKELAGVVEQGLRSGWFAPERNSRMVRSMALVRRGWHGVITEEHAFRGEDLARDPFQNEYIRPNGYASYAGAVVAQAPGVVLPVSIERLWKQGSFSRQEVALMNRLFGHLRAAGDLAVRVGMASTRGLADALSAVGHPLALIGHDGCVIHMNERFERLLGQGVLVKGGRLASWHGDANRALAAAVERARRHDGTLRAPFRPVVLPRPGGLRPLVAQIVPVVGAARDVLHLVAAIVTLTDLEAANAGPAEALLEQGFGLTPAEARLASQLTAGKTLAELSHQDGVSRETLRSRLKAIFEKTGTGRQAELVKLLSKIVPS